jgi:hypothetical protein
LTGRFSAKPREKPVGDKKRWFARDWPIMSARSLEFRVTTSQHDNYIGVIF